MALYEGLKQGRFVDEPAPQALRRPRPAEPAAWRTVRAQVREEVPSGAPFMDRFLGTGSGRALQGAVGALFGGGGSDKPRSKPAPAPRARDVQTRSTPRMQVVGAEEDHLPHGRKGVGRAVLVILALSGTTMALRPWQKAGLLKSDWSAIFQVKLADDGKDSAQAAQAQVAVQSAQDAAKLAALPLQAATGRVLGLWQDGSGRWWRVDGEGALAPCEDPSGSENLGLPEIRGVAAHAEPYRGGKRLLLDLPSGRLAELLPLQASVASEVRSLDMQDPAQPVLLTLDGVRCLMGDGDWGQRQKRLALVLADLAARRRRAGQVDLRFEGTAVVRPLGR